MSSHLRHCPKHRKPLPCAHCALVAKPSTNSEPAAVEPVKPKRGRPPKGDRAMTDAERKREQRRSDSIADVLAIPDSRGRLHNERSGEADRRFGMSEMERIVAAQDRDENGSRCTGGEGAGPTEMEQDTSADKADFGSFDVKSTKADLRAEYLDDKAFQRFEENMEAAGEYFAETAPDGTRRCRLFSCRVSLNSIEDRERHLWQAYDRGHRQYGRLELLKEANAPQDLIDEANRRFQNDSHFRCIMRFLKSRKPVFS